MTQAEHRQGWELARTAAQGGTGNWKAFKMPLSVVEEAAAKWKAEVGQQENLWLCWNVNDRWCLVQQQLVRELGWTPVVGWDPNCGVTGPGNLAPGAIAIDFNADLKLPNMFMHFPLEFAFLWAERLAFWHSDFLMDRPAMRRYGEMFARIPDGKMSATFSFGGIRNILNVKSHRFFELLGCTTKGASSDQFKKGCGWWRNFEYHPNAPTGQLDPLRRQQHYNEHGVGIRYWEKHWNGIVEAIPERKIAKYHFSINTVKGYKKGRDKSEEMDINFDLSRIARELGILDLIS